LQPLNSLLCKQLLEPALNCAEIPDKSYRGAGDETEQGAITKCLPGNDLQIFLFMARILLIDEENKLLEERS
jgi:hypothetical protein